MGLQKNWLAGTARSVGLAAVRGLLPRIATSGRGARGDAPRPVFSFGSGQSGLPGWAVARGELLPPTLPRAAVSNLRGVA
jgi:hypothetical protein